MARSEEEEKGFCNIDCKFPLLVKFLVSCVIQFVVLFTMVSTIYIIITPKSPVFQVESINTTTPFTVDNLATTVNGGLNITFWVANPNKGAIYNKATVQVYYRNLLLLSSSTPFDSLCPGVPSCKDMTQSWLPVTINVSSVPVFDPLIASAIMSDLRREKLSLNVKIVADYRAINDVDNFARLRVSCNDMKVGVPTGVMIGGPKNCKVDWSSDGRTTYEWSLCASIAAFVSLSASIVNFCCCDGGRD